MAKTNTTGLTDLQQRFCQEYLKDFNATAAYIRAGYKAKRTAAERASSRLLRNVEVQAYLAKRINKAERKSEVTLEKTVSEVAKLAFSDITDTLRYGDEGVCFKDSEELPRSVTSTIESVSSTRTIIRNKDGGETETVNLKLKLHSKTAALNWLGQYFSIGGDFNQARATLIKYGYAMVADDSELGWRLEKYDPTSGTSTAETESAASEFIEDIAEAEEG